MPGRFDMDAMAVDHEGNRIGRVDRRTEHHQGGERKKQFHQTSPGISEN
jgi:hypothetical protein